MDMGNNYLTPQEREFYNQLDRWDKEAEEMFATPKPAVKDPDKLLSRLEISRQIKYEKEALSDEDAEGHIWWNRFEELINNL